MGQDRKLLVKNRKQLRDDKARNQGLPLFNDEIELG
jgi:hypothetical protein